MKNLVLFGDSLISLFSKDEVLMLEKKTGCDVYNCAISGWNTEDGATKASYISLLNPDVVVLSFGTNDSAQWKSVELERVAKNVQKIIDYFSSSEIIFLLPPPTKDKQRSNELIKKYSDTIKSVLTENGAGYIDSWKIFKEMLDSGKNYHDTDNLHFNELGYKTVINEIAYLISRYESTI